MSSAHETEIFQHYQVLKRPDGALWELGRGAMGITYKAFDTNLRCDVALKVINALHLNSETARARFLREARAAAGLRHRNVASVYHLGNDDQSFFYAMEFVDGETIESLVKETGPMPPADALQVVVQIARALGAAAKQNLVHRDIKPANIMVTREDDEEEQFVVKVIDFGLARPAIGGEGSAHITMGGFVGTPQFASPEQLEEKDLDARSDIYSLGVTLWFMIAGRPPFTGPLGSVFIQQLTKEPPWAQLEGTPEPVRALLAAMLEKEPDKRPQTPVELRRQVEACLRQLPASDRQSRPADYGATGTLAESVANTEAPLTRSVIWTAGSVLGGRYELAELAGEGTNGRVFRASDRQANGASVAVKILHGDVLASSAERRRLEGELDKLRGAAHPNLLEFQGLREAADTSFLVGEWVNGFTLVDLLRSRGQLPLPETLRLLAQAAAVADHARECDLRRLELSLHQIMTEFGEPAAGALDARAALTTSLDQWPPFVLKLDALGITREAGDSVTWAGDQTLMPAAPLLGRDTQTSIRGFVEGSDLFALGLMAYELLNGAPPAHSQRGGGREARYVALPALNEAANLVLRRVLSPNPGFGSNVDFFRALVDASGLPEVYLEALAPGSERETFAVERLPNSGEGAEEAGATLILEDGESLDQTATMRGPSAEERARAEEERLALARAEAEKERAERAEARRIATEQARVEREEAERVAAEQAETERIKAERVRAERAEAKRVETERIAAERAETKRVAAEKAAVERAEAERLAAQRAEAERVEAERVAAERAVAKRLEAERREADRLEAERVATLRAEAKRVETERLQREKAEADRLAAEQAEAERIEAERLSAERAEAKRLEAIRLKAEKAERDRLAAEQAEAQRLETERIAAERAEAKRLETIRSKAEKAERDRLAAEQAEAQRLEAERIAAERAEAKRLETERLQAEKAAADRLRAERVEAKRLEALQLKAQKAEADRLKVETAEAARLEAIRLKKERDDAKQLAAEQAKSAKAEAERERAAVLRDVASVAGVDSAPQQALVPAKKNTKVLVGAAVGVLALTAVGIAVFSLRHETPPAVKVTTKVEPAVKPEEAAAPTTAVTPPPPATEAIVEASSPTPAPVVAAAVEPSPPPDMTPEPSATPALAEAKPEPPVAATPAPVSKPDQPDEREDRRESKSDRAARLAEERKRQAEAAEASRVASRSRDEPPPPREREKHPVAAASEPKKKTPERVAASKPAGKPKPEPTPAPANRPAGPFILR